MSIISGVLGTLIDECRDITRDKPGDAFGTSTSTSASKLVDSSATFITDGVEAGQTVYNITDNTSATISSVDSETQLTLGSDIFTVGERYRVIFVNPSKQTLKWSDDEWIDYLNQAEREVCERADAIEARTDATVCRITVVTDTNLYSTDSSIIRVDEKAVFTYDDSMLQKVTEDYLNENRAGWREETGQPTEFILYPYDKIRLVPQPTSTFNGYYVWLTVLSKYPSTVLARTNVTPEVGSKYYEAMKMWACHLAYMKQGAETADEGKSRSFETVFDAMVGPRQSALVQRVMRQEPDYIQFQVRR